MVVEEWSRGIITPIPKWGEIKNQDNYCGITMNSCLSKLFNFLPNNRLLYPINENNILKNNQRGFRKCFRIADHLLTIKTLMDKYLSEIRNCISALWTSGRHMIVYGVRHYLKSY